MAIKEIKHLRLTAAILLILTACAATPPANPLANISSIVGDWKGTFLTGRGAAVPATMSITQAGDYKTERSGNDGPVRGGGKLTLRDGRAYTDGGSAVSLHERDGKPVLILNTRSGGQGEYTRVK